MKKERKKEGERGQHRASSETTLAIWREAKERAHMPRVLVLCLSSVSKLAKPGKPELLGPWEGPGEELGDTCLLSAALLGS